MEAPPRSPCPRLARALCLAACLTAAPAPAQDPPAPAPPPGSATPPTVTVVSIEELWVRGERAFRSGDLETAFRLFTEALARDDRRGRSWNYVGGVHFARGDLPRALEHFDRAHELDPTDVRSCNNLATAHERLGQLARAEELYQRAAQLDPAYPETYRNLGVLYARRLGRPEAARHAWQRFLELVPTGAAAAAVRRELEVLPPSPPATPSPAAAP
jgi:tetratricopeptide (TPR) repeat protein